MDLKRLAAVLIFLLIAIPTASALTVVTFSGASCDAEGIGTFDLMHTGNLIQVKDLKVDERFEDEKAAAKVEGTWYQSGLQVTYLKPNLQEQGFNKIQLITKTSSLTKTGKYTIILEFPRSSLVGDVSKIQTTVACPGLVCSSNVQCRDDEQCMNKTCTSLNCNSCQIGLSNRCVSKCDDADPCSVDLCNEGACSHDRITNCCKTNIDCYDEKACTTDNCVNNRCVRAPITCGESKDPCTKGVCREPVGCEYKTNPLCAANSTERQYVLNVGEPEVTASSQSFLGRLFAYLASWFR